MNFLVGPLINAATVTVYLSLQALLWVLFELQVPLRSRSEQQRSANHTPSFDALWLLMCNIYSSLVGWMNISPWLPLAVGSRKQPVRRALTDGDKSKSFANLSPTRHLRFQTVSSKKSARWLRRWRAYFSSRWTTIQHKESGWMRRLQCRINLNGCHKQVDKRFQFGRILLRRWKNDTSASRLGLRNKNSSHSGESRPENTLLRAQRCSSHP